MTGGSTQEECSPLFGAKAYEAPSVFTPGSLVREARRQKNLDAARVPRVCVLDPDGDLVRFLVSEEKAERMR